MTTPQLATFKVPVIDNEPMVSIHERPVLRGILISVIWTESLRAWFVRTRGLEGRHRADGTGDAVRSSVHR